MGTVIAFPIERRHATPLGGGQGPGASIVILPVIRIERYDGAPEIDSVNAARGPATKGAGVRRRRSRRGSRS